MSDLEQEIEELNSEKDWLYDELKELD